MTLSRMDLADAGSPEKIAQTLLDQISDLPIPVPVDDIAAQLDIVSIEPLETDGFEGGLLTDREKSQGIILVNQASSRKRRRFTIGHELGHFLCPAHQPRNDGEFRCSSEDMRRASAGRADRAAQMEVEANRFAALLLMPMPYFRNDMRQCRGADIEHIIAIAARYVTSKEATARRYVELHDDPCAIVLSRHGKVDRVYRGSEFPYIELSNGSPVPRESLTLSSQLPEGTVSEWRETDGCLWLPTKRGIRAPTVYEQVLSQRDGYRMTLLTVETVDEDEQSDEEMEESWTPTFRRRR